MRLNTKQNYRLAQIAGIAFLNDLAGDEGFQDPEINAVALQERLVGWISCQPWFLKFMRRLKAHPRDGGMPHASDLALEVATDITAGNARFDVGGKAKPFKHRLFIETKGGYITGVFHHGTEPLPVVFVVDRNPEPELQCLQMQVQPLDNADKETLEIVGECAT